MTFTCEYCHENVFEGHLATCRMVAEPQKSTSGDDMSPEPHYCPAKPAFEADGDLVFRIGFERKNADGTTTIVY